MIELPADIGHNKCTQGVYGVMIEEKSSLRPARPLLPPAGRRFSAVPVAEGQLQPALPPPQAVQGARVHRRFAPRPIVLLQANEQKGGQR